MQNKDQDIFRAQQLDLIYAQSGILYEIIPNAPRSNFDPKIKPRPHANGIVGSNSTKLVDSITKQVSQLSINQSTLGQAMTSSQPTQSASVISVQSSNPKGNQQPGRKRKKEKIIIRVGTRTEMLIIMKRTLILRGKSSLNVR